MDRESKLTAACDAADAPVLRRNAPPFRRDALRRTPPQPRFSQYPNSASEVSFQALDWLMRYLNRFEGALLGSTPGDWRRYVDLGSAVDYLLVLELTKNPDAYRGSTYLSKDRDPAPLAFGPGARVRLRNCDCARAPPSGASDAAHARRPAARDFLSLETALRSKFGRSHTALHRPLAPAAARLSPPAARSVGLQRGDGAVLRLPNRGLPAGRRPAAGHDGRLGHGARGLALRDLRRPAALRARPHRRHQSVVPRHVEGAGRFWGVVFLCRRKRGKGKSGALAVGCRRLLPPAPRLSRHSYTHARARSNTFRYPHQLHPPKTSKAQDEAFRAQVAARWRELRAGPLSDAWVSDNLEGTAGRIREAALRNYARWGDALRWEAYGGGFADDGAQLDAEVAALGAWLRARLAWMDGQLSGGGGGGVAASDGA